MGHGGAQVAGGFLGPERDIGHVGQFVGDGEGRPGGEVQDAAPPVAAVRSGRFHQPVIPLHPAPLHLYQSVQRQSIGRHARHQPA